MEKVKPLQVFVFHKKTQPSIDLYLYKGIVYNDNGALLSADERFRWMIKGLQNPFPVRNGTWFAGFEIDVMRKYLVDNGYFFTEAVPIYNL